MTHVVAAPIRLTRADYERALRLAADVRIAELELAAATERMTRKLAAARAANEAHLKILSRRYRGFHATDVQYRPEDATCTMHPIADATAIPNRRGGEPS